MEEEDSEQKQSTSELGQLLLDLTNIPAYTHSDQDIHESPNSPIEGNYSITFDEDYQINLYIIWNCPNYLYGRYFETRRYCQKVSRGKATSATQR